MSDGRNTLHRLCDGSIYFHEVTEVYDGQETALFTCRPKDIDLDAKVLRELGEAMVRAAEVLEKQR